jgi:glucose-1-phosphate adenylyltransferase
MREEEARRSSGQGVTVVILGGGRGTRLDPLTRERSKPAVPLAGNYRLIDVPISNALNSGLMRIFVLTQFNSVSLHQHLTATYKFSPFSRGFVEVLAAQQTPSSEAWFQGTADAVRQNLGFLTEQPSDKTLILSGDHLYRMDYDHVLLDHLGQGADVTLCVLPCTEEEIAGFGAVRVDDQGRVVEFREKPATPEARAGMEVPAHLRLAPEKPYLGSMGIYLFNEQVLCDCLDSDATDFGSEVLPAAVDRVRVQAHMFHGYWRDIGTIRAFYETHMDLVRPNPAFDFYDPDWRIFTHPRYLPGSRVKNSRLDRAIVAAGCEVTDSDIQESIVGLRAVAYGATVRSTLLMGVDESFPEIPGAPRVGIGRGSRVENAIIDKNARIGRDVQLVNEKGLQEAEGDGWVIRDGIIVVPKNGVIPDGTVV